MKREREREREFKQYTMSRGMSSVTIRFDSRLGSSLGPPFQAEGAGAGGGDESSGGQDDEVQKRKEARNGPLHSPTPRALQCTTTRGGWV